MTKIITKSELKQLINETVNTAIRKYVDLSENEVNDNDTLDNPLFEMAAIGNLNPQYSIWIRSKDGGNIPHFHIFDVQTEGRKFNSAIYIEDNRYFEHGKSKSKLSRQMRIQLVKFLKRVDEDGITNWSFLVNTWNRNNSNRMVPNERKRNMPDYTTIKPYK